MNKKTFHAGSLYQNYLVLYRENEIPRIIKVENEDLQWEIYCNDIELDHESDSSATFNFKDNQYLLPCWKSSEPMKFFHFQK